MNLGVMDEEDDIDPALAEAAGVEMPTGRPNVPRNPDDPREKIKQYLMSQEKASQLRQDPAYRAMERAPAEAINESNRSIDFAKLLNQSANQFGSLGGKVASSAPLDQFSKGLKESNQNALGSIMGQRQAAAGDEDRQLKIKQYLADKYQSDEDRAMKRDMLASNEKRANQMLGIQRDKLDIMRQQKDNKAAGAGEGFKALDKDYAKDYNEWTGIGRGALTKNLKLLEDAKKEIQGSKENLSGNIQGRAPDMFRSEKSRVMQQKVQEAAQGALKATLGAQFTEKEGTAIMARAYDPTLSPQANLAKIDDAIATLKSNALIADKKARYFEQNGTLAGFKDPRGNVPIEEDIGTKNAPEKAAAKQAGGATRKGLEEMTPEEIDAELAEHQQAGRL